MPADGVRSRGGVALAIALAGLASSACTRAPEPSPVPPEPARAVADPAPALPALELDCPGCNLLVLNVGNLRADRVGLLEETLDAKERGLTPHIDRFFERGLIFEQASAPSGATYYSATAIATGTEAMLNGHAMRVEDGLGLPDVSEQQAQQWYEGGGRWLVLVALERDGELLVDRLPTLAQTLSGAGWHASAVNDWIHTGEHVRLDRGFTDYLDLTSTEAIDHDARTTTVPIDEQVDLVVASLEEHRLLRGEQPLYLYFHPNTLHFPYPDPRGSGSLVGKAGNRLAFTKGYQAQIQALDAAFARIFVALEAGGWLEDTVVLLYANHGLELGRGDYLGMGRAYQACVHVPMLMRHPGLDQPRRVDAPVSLVDLAPTLYELLAVDEPPATTAHSMLPLLEGRGPYPRELIFGRDIQEEYVRRGPWKLIVAQGGTRELYDLSRDPGETTDRTAEHPELVAELALALERERVRQQAWADERQAAIEERP